MALDLRDCSFFGPALPEPFVKYQLEKHLKKRDLLPKNTGDEGKILRDSWDVYRRKLRMLGEQGGERRVANHVYEPLVSRLGYQTIERQETVITREGAENGGYLMTSAEDGKLRCWSVAVGTDLDAPNRRGRAYRFSPSRIAQRVLLAQGERVGLLTNGEELRLLICDPARPDSHIAIGLDRSSGWRGAYRPPDSYRLLSAIAAPAGVDAVSELTDAARLAQSAVTDKLRIQARRAVEGFVQALLDHPENVVAKEAWEDIESQAKQIWREGLILVYRLLFIFKLESSADPARAFSFATTALWRDTYSPNVALAGMVRRLLDEGADTGVMLEDGLRTLFRMFAEGMQSSELNIRPLGGMLFGQHAIPLTDGLRWGEHAVAQLLDHLLWTPGDKKTERERVHYATLDVEDMGRVYEALLELEPGISMEPMCRLKRAKLEVVVPAAQGEPYRVEEGAKKSGKTKVEWIEEIPSGRFYLRVGLGRKASGSYYTPHPFVRFLVQETLGPQVEERSPRTDPQPGKLLELTVLDPAMGSGHFLAEACRYLGDALYEACRLCDELAVQAEEEAGTGADAVRTKSLARAQELWKRVEDLPDPEDELLAYLPSRVAEGEESGLSQQKAEAMCRRLVAVHCLYGVDKNPMAVELAKLSLWLESYAEGLPLTFLDHRLICGDSLTGPFFEHLLTYPGSGEKLDDLFSQGLSQRLTETLEKALSYVKVLEASVGKDVSDLEQKRIAKQKLDEALEPFKLLAAAWSGGVMLGSSCDDQAYATLAKAVVGTSQDVCNLTGESSTLGQMVNLGRAGIAFDLAFPEIFRQQRGVENRGFHAVIGNPPWDKPRFERKEVIGSLCLEVLELQRRSEWEPIAEEFLQANTASRQAVHQLEQEWQYMVRALRRDFDFANGRGEDISAPGDKDLYSYFLERMKHTISYRGAIGVLVGGGLVKNPSAAGIRKLMVREASLRLAIHFTNKERLFADLPQVLEFCAVVGAGSQSRHTSMATVLTERTSFSQLLEAVQADRNINLNTVTGSDWSILPAVIPSLDANPLLSDFLLNELGKFTRELDRTTDDEGFVSLRRILPDADDARSWEVTQQLIARGYLPIRGSRTFQVLHPSPEGLGGKRSPKIELVVRVGYPKASRFLNRSRYYRLGIRRHVGSIHTNERSLVPCIFTPGFLANDQLIIEGAPAERPNSRSLAVAGVLSAHSTEVLIRPYVGSMMSMKILDHGRIPSNMVSIRALLAHNALRLISWDAGYADLWEEQFNEAWREAKSEYTWPALESDDDRWAVRAAIDAVVANAYGLDREQYEHILSTFSHKSYPKTPELCLAAFDELQSIGLEAFAKKHDPYWDIPLNENLPKPVIDLPIPSNSAEQVREATLPLYGSPNPEEEDE